MSKDLKTLIILYKTIATLEVEIKKSLDASDLSINEFAAMEALYNKGRLTTKELTHKVLIPNSSMSYVIDILSKRGYISKLKDVDDRRIQYLSLTDAGSEVFEKVYEKHYNHIRPLFNVLESDEELKLQTYLKRIGLQERRGNDHEDHN